MLQRLPLLTFLHRRILFIHMIYHILFFYIMKLAFLLIVSDMLQGAPSKKHHVQMLSLHLKYW